LGIRERAIGVGILVDDCKNLLDEATDNGLGGKYAFVVRKGLALALEKK
jgi:hypothetical protein